MEDAVLYSLRGKTLRYILPPPEEQEGEGDADLSEVDVAGLVIAGRFFRLGKRVASPEKCRRCGRCCLTLGRAIKASPGDLERWIREGREDVLLYLKLEEDGDALVTDGTLEIGDESGRCVFLIKDGNVYACAIHETKPEVCAEYPLNVGGVCKGGVGCESLVISNTIL
ncbi:YkgJ family cysteine cluster protein [Candidatus Pyrohabitans sp.]